MSSERIDLHNVLYDARSYGTAKRGKPPAAGLFSRRMQCVQLPIHGALLLTPLVHSDARGYFKEVYSAPRFESVGVNDLFVQDNVSLSSRFALRGLHADDRMAKLVQVLNGMAFDVIVDLRRQSPTFLNWHGVNLSAGNHHQVYIPQGCLHGFLALEDHTLLSYKQSAAYDPRSEIGIRWDDPDLAIDWPLHEATPLLSAKDAANPTLRDLGYL